MVMRLHKSLYGLKQAGRQSYDTLVRVLTDLGFRISQADLGVLQTWVQGDTLILAIHINDCMITGSSSNLIAEYKKKIHAAYPLTDLGPIHWLLGIRITQDCKAQITRLSQELYIKSILIRFALEDAKSTTTPMVPGVTYSQEDAPDNPINTAKMGKTPYWEAIGSLMYASIPDIAFAVSMLLQFLENPWNRSLGGSEANLHYLSGTKAYQLTYGAEKNDLIGCTDADGTNQEHHYRSLQHVPHRRGAISWSS